MANSRKSRKEELLAAARDRLVEAANGEEDRGPEIRYRGQVVRQGGGSGTPGSGIGNSRSGRRSSSGGKDNDVRDALQKIKDLYSDGLISRAEAEKKRSEILDRL